MTYRIIKSKHERNTHKIIKYANYRTMQPQTMILKPIVPNVRAPVQSLVESVFIGEWGISVMDRRPLNGIMERIFISFEGRERTSEGVMGWNGTPFGIRHYRSSAEYLIENESWGIAMENRTCF